MTDTTDKLLEERAKTHGSFSTHAQTTQSLKRVIRTQMKYAAFPCDSATTYYLSDEHREALDMILHKIGRIMAGDANYKDHWDDISGYAKLGSLACKTKLP